MKIRTSTVAPTPCEDLWPLLTDSQMTASGCFCLGLPRPVACELPNAAGAVGAERRCISDRGVVVQTITIWQPPHRLCFQMASTNHCWGSHVESLQEDFLLEDLAGRTRITRTTKVSARGFPSLLKELLFCLGLKRVHLYVFKNWRQQAAASRI